MDVSREQGVYYYDDFSEAVRCQDARTWGVQVVIVRDGMMFVQSDVDAMNRVEAHESGGGVVFPEMGLRANGAGGGKKEGESFQTCAVREMKAELGIGEDGILRILEELPIVACGQIRKVDGQQRGSLLGVVLAAYEPSLDEWDQLKGKGEMIPIEEVLVQANKDEKLEMRPTFRQALQIGALLNEGNIGGIETLVGGYNLMVIEAMRDECLRNNIELKEGIFEN